ncbi:MAG: type 1 glutamine amidotransferase [Methanomassiliicoccales archaeon]|nr:MAG: type 1 glutamine amidotransferase [Methanomassiliicoccales archaeon]
MTTLLLDNFLEDKYSGYFSRYLQDDLEIFKASNSEFPRSLKRYDHIILSGSEDSILTDKTWIEEEMGLVKEIIDLGIPTLGICFGHQLIAKALLGPDGVRRANPPEIGWKKVTVIKDNPLFTEVDKDFFVFNSHFDEVYRPTSDFEIIASSAQCDIHAFQIKNAPVWGIQFHPEIDMESGKKFLLDIRHLAMDLDMDSIIRKAKDSGISRRFFENFYGL